MSTRPADVPVNIDRAAAGEAARSTLGRVAPATDVDLRSWDDRAVHAPGGHVYQSLAWGRHRERQGWRTVHLELGDGSPALVLMRPWRRPVPGWSAYVPRGPVTADDAGRTAERIRRLADHLAEQGVDVVAVDPEVPGGLGLGPRLEAAGFHPIEELEPSRHRLDVELPTDCDDLVPSFDTKTRGRLRQALRQGLIVEIVDGQGTALGSATRIEPGDPAADATLDAFVAIARSTAARRRFRLAEPTAVRSWARACVGQGLGLLVAVRSPEGEPLAAGLFYRHGRRLTYALAGEFESARRDYPGATRLMILRAMEVAVLEGRATMDLGGVDTPGARRMPRPGEAQFGLLQFKVSFGARWVEMTGAHERVIRPLRYLAGRVAARLPA